MPLTPYAPAKQPDNLSWFLQRDFNESIIYKHEDKLAGQYRAKGCRWFLVAINALCGSMTLSIP